MMPEADINAARGSGEYCARYYHERDRFRLRSGHVILL